MLKIADRLLATSSNIITRQLQGIGGGGMSCLVNVIIVDLVSQRERTKFSGIIALAGAFGLVAGVLGGAALAQEAWRWVVDLILMPFVILFPSGKYVEHAELSSPLRVFYLNLPTCIPTLVGFAFFLHLKEKTGSPIKKVMSMDWTGILILLGSIAAILFGLISGGTVYAWSSARILTPLICGSVGLISFALFEEYVADRHLFAPPMIPLRLFVNRIASSGYAITFIHAVILWAIAYYYLLYVSSISLHLPPLCKE
jgi:MFS family permease